MRSFNTIYLLLICIIITISRSFTSDLPLSISENDYCDTIKESNVTEVFPPSHECYSHRSNRSPDINSHSIYENRILSDIAARLLNVNGPFDASISESTSTTCKLHSKQYMDALKSLDLWAFQMYDASAKIPSGILNGNVNQFGDFDQCLSVNHSSGIRGQYCLAHIQIDKPDKQYERLSVLHKFVHLHYPIVNDIDDFDILAPKLSTINWALCVPSSCHADTIEQSFKQHLDNYTAGLPFSIDVRVNKEMCYVQKTTGYDRNTKIAAAIFIFVIFIAIISTILDYKVKVLNPWLKAFSLHTNIRDLFNVVSNPRDIRTIHGIRFINAVLILLTHKSMALMYNPYANRTVMGEHLGKLWSGIGRISLVYTDPFLLLSGLLTSYEMYGRLQRGQPLRIFSTYAGRYLRIVPALGVTILFCMHILPNLGTGPQWNLVVVTYADKCKKYWWRNLLFIQNYFGYNDMCLLHTHHLGTDINLFLFAPFLVVLLWKWPKKGTILLLTIAGITTIGRFHVTVVHKLSYFLYHGMSLKQSYKTIEYIHIVPIYRSTIYILGVLLGYVLRIGKKWTLTPIQRNIGLTISISLLLPVLLCPLIMTHSYNVYHAGIFSAVSSIGWCGIFAWIIFSSHLGYENIVTQILSWKGFLITTRLSYALYLIQIQLFYYNVGQVRYPEHYKLISKTLNVWEYCWVILSTIILTLLVDMPFQNMKQILFRNGKSVEETKPLNGNKNQ